MDAQFIYVGECKRNSVKFQRAEGTSQFALGLDNMAHKYWIASVRDYEKEKGLIDFKLRRSRAEDLLNPCSCSGLSTLFIYLEWK